MSQHIDLEAEQIVLGAMLSGEPIEIGALAGEHFYDPTHQALFAQMRALSARGERADGMALRQWAETHLIPLGGRGYLLKLMEHGARIRAEVAGASALVQSLYARRTAADTLTLALEALKRGDDVLETLAASEAAMREIAGTGSAAGADAPTAASSFIEHMDVPSIATGILALDERMGGLHRGELTILAGRPSMGKTALADQIARNIAERGAAVHFASLEMPKEALAARSMSAFSWRRETGFERVEYYHLRNGSNVDRALLRALAAELPRSLVIDDRAAQTLAQLEHSARATRRRLGRLDLIVVDYLQLMRAAREQGRVQEVSEISAGLKAIAKRLGVPVLALSQLSRQVENRENKRPQLSDLRESGSIEQDADAVLACYREAYYLERTPPEPDAPTGDHVAWKHALERCKRDMEIITLKQRSGPTGTDRLEAWLEFDVVRDRVAA